MSRVRRVIHDVGLLRLRAPGVVARSTELKRPTDGESHCYIGDFAVAHVFPRHGEHARAFAGHRGRARGDGVRDYHDEVRRKGELFESALGRLSSDPVASTCIQDLRDVREAIWDDISTRLAHGSEPRVEFVEAVIRPAWSYDEELVVLVEKWSRSEADPAAPLDALRRATDNYAELVNRTRHARVHLLKKRIRKRIIELRCPPKTEWSAPKVSPATAEVIAEALSDEGLPHPDDEEWTRVSVVNIADELGLTHLFPANRQPPKIQERIGPTPVRGAATRVPAMRLTRGPAPQSAGDPAAPRRGEIAHRDARIAADIERLLALLRRHPEGLSAKAIRPKVRGGIGRTELRKALEHAVRGNRIRTDGTSTKTRYYAANGPDRK